jgi:hypothetical protein
MAKNMAENDKSLARSALVVAILFLIGGLYVFFKDYTYKEEGHLILLGAYVLLCGLFYLFFKLWKIGLTAFTVLLMVFCLTLIVQKYEWRKDYVDAATPFFLEEYIKDYPSFEEHLKISYMGGENWIAFSKECAEPAMLAKVVSLDCKSISAVKNKYGIDLKAAVNAYFKKMQGTAKRVSGGKLKTTAQYRTCIQNKSCAQIPMLPKNVNADDIDPNSHDHKEIREAYWALIEEKKMTAPVCKYMKLCKIMLELEIVNLENFKL